MKKNRIPSEADHRTVQAGRRYGALVLTMLACAALTCPALAAASLRQWTIAWICPNQKDQPTHRRAGDTASW